MFNSFYSYGKLSQVWGDEYNNSVGFVEISSDELIEAVATDPQFQKMGVGRFMLTKVLKNTKGESFSNIKSIISSDNIPSLNLHKRLGIFEVERRAVFQLDLK